MNDAAPLSALVFNDEVMIHRSSYAANQGWLPVAEICSVHAQIICQARRCVVRYVFFVPPGLLTTV